jgi:hypothetical protein
VRRTRRRPARSASRGEATREDHRLRAPGDEDRHDPGAGRYAPHRGDVGPGGAKPGECLLREFVGTDAPEQPRTRAQAAGHDSGVSGAPTGRAQQAPRDRARSSSPGALDG